MRRVTLLITCFAISCTPPAQQATCPAIEVSPVAEEQSDLNRSVALNDGRQILLTEEPLVTTGDVTGANASFTEGQWVLNVNLTAGGARRVQLFSEQNVGRTMALLVDGEVVRTPTIQDPITGNGVLVGAFERTEAERLAEAINGCQR